ncbi:SH3 domain-containing protein [Flagellimonas onchidii]|uniref:SH3 domain-containing protein n=1 Tax=Flagellimonas onchidii TaxID=2562684 RepID=UPI0010A68C03|nr:SH3 domain-containing protein [Allomuricauda onchidii]
MKTTTSILALAFILLVGCKDDTKSNKNENSQSAKIFNTSDSTTVFKGVIANAICLWPKVGLRDQPGRKNAKYLATIYYGETVQFLNEKKQADDNKEYIKLKLSDGTEGWAYEYLFAMSGKLGIVENATELYKRPDIMTFEGEKIEPIDMVVLLETEQEGWHKVVGLKKELNGWIQNTDSILTTELDVKMGILYWRAQEETGVKKYDLLENIVNNPAFKKAKLIHLVNQELFDEEGEVAVNIELYEEYELPSNKLRITAMVTNVRSEPKVDAENIVFQVKQGDVCNIIAQGSSLEEVNNNTDRWYKINYNGQEGWVFGFNTSKRRN